MPDKQKLKGFIARQTEAEGIHCQKKCSKKFFRQKEPQVAVWMHTKKFRDPDMVKMRINANIIVFLVLVVLNNDCPK